MHSFRHGIHPLTCRYTRGDFGMSGNEGGVVFGQIMNKSNELIDGKHMAVSVRLFKEGARSGELERQEFILKVNEVQQHLVATLPHHRAK